MVGGIWSHKTGKHRLTSGINDGPIKLAAVDTASQNSIIRVVSLAAAGVVCFVLSLLYNRFAQEQRRESNQAPMGPGSI